MIFSTIEDVKLVFAPPNINNDIDSLMPYLDEALHDVLPYLSQAQWDKLDADFADGSANEDHLALLKVVRKALVHFAYLKHSDDGTMQISDKGYNRVKADDEDSAWAWQMNNFVKARIRDGWIWLNRLLELLNSKPEVYTEWAESKEREYILSFFLWNLADFKKQRSIADLRMLDSLRNSMLHVQDEVIKRNLGAELYEELKDQLLNDDDFSPDNKALIPFIHKAIANLSTARAIEEGIVAFNEKGLTVRSTRNDQGDNETEASLKKIAMFEKDAREKGASALKDLRDYLNKNASSTKYPSYYTNEDLYDDPTDTTDQSTFTNAAGGTYFGV
jgi:uncharacterized protein DUF6712